MVYYLRKLKMIKSCLRTRKMLALHVPFMKTISFNRMCKHDFDFFVFPFYVFISFILFLYFSLFVVDSARIHFMEHASRESRVALPPKGRLRQMVILRLFNNVYFRRKFSVQVVFTLYDCISFNILT